MLGQYNLPSTGDSVSQAQTRKVTIPGLTKVNSVTTNTGTVTHSVSGTEITLNCANGNVVRTDSYTPSQSATDYRESTSSTYAFPESVSYSSGGMSGTLYKSGSVTPNTVNTPSDTTYVTATGSSTSRKTWTWTGSGWSGGTTDHTYSSSYNYNSGGYVGTLGITASNLGVPPYPNNNGTYLNQTTTTSASGTVTYGGNVTKPASSTTYYRQNYSGYIYGASSYTSYYAYIVTINYETYTQIGTIKAKSGQFTYTIPIYDTNLSGYCPLRINTSKGIGVFELVETASANASPLRIKTKNGVKALSYLTKI